LDAQIQELENKIQKDTQSGGFKLEDDVKLSALRGDRSRIFAAQAKSLGKNESNTIQNFQKMSLGPSTETKEDLFGTNFDHHSPVLIKRAFTTRPVSIRLPRAQRKQRLHKLFPAHVSRDIVPLVIRCMICDKSQFSPYFVGHFGHIVADSHITAKNPEPVYNLVPICRSCNGNQNDNQLERWCNQGKAQDAVNFLFTCFQDAVTENSSETNFWQWILDTYHYPYLNARAGVGVSEKFLKWISETVPSKLKVWNQSREPTDAEVDEFLSEMRNKFDDISSTFTEEQTRRAQELLNVMQSWMVENLALAQAR